MSIRVYGITPTFYINYFIQTSTVKKEEKQQEEDKKKTDLTEDTKRELESLGISATEDMTESEAQSKIAQAKEEEKAKAEEDIPKSSNMPSILNKIKILAEKLGVPYSNNEEVDTVLEKIKYFIYAVRPQIQEDEEQLRLLEDCNNEYINLKAEFETARNFQIEMYNSVDIAATNNKFLLGL